VHHSIAQSRKFGSSKFFEDLDQTNAGKMARHKLIQVHEPSGRRNIYIAAHAHHIEGISKEESDALIKKLLDHVTRKTNTISVDWRQASDTIIWDNRCTLNKANGGSFEGKYRRDLRRTTVHDDSSTALGLNEVENDTEKWIVNHAATRLLG
jgi:alpha-ketoglutarate-dependent 2,4-dichlorophenoxyacetate dioxygenase